MEAKVEISHTGQVMLYTYSGVLNVDDAVSFGLERYADPIPESIKVYLSDFTQCDVSGVKTDDVIRAGTLFQDARKQYSDYKPVVWIAEDDLAFGISRMRQGHDSIDEKNVMKVFRTMDEGLEWVKEYLDSL